MDAEAHFGVDEAMFNKDVPQKRCDQVAVFLDGRLVVIGGIFDLVWEDQHEYSYRHLMNNVIWTFTMDTFRWEKFIIPAGENLPPGTLYTSSTVIGRDIYMHGGDIWLNGSAQMTNSTWKLSGSPQHGFRWSEITIKNNNQAPSPRKYHSGWAYNRKLWIFGGYGYPLHGYLNTSGASFDPYDPTGVQGFNNQLLCFNPSLQKWTNPHSYGAVPEPRSGRYFTQFDTKVWLCRMCNAGDTDFLLELNMQSLVWTKLKVDCPIRPSERICHTFTALSEYTFVLHGGYDIATNDALSDTWLLDLPSASWRKYTGSSDHGRTHHSATKSIHNNIIIFGGCLSKRNLPAGSEEELCNDIYVIQMQPESLMKLTSKVVCKHRAVLQSHWKNLPRTLHAQLMEMCQDDDVVQE